jgi:galactonate dehydratase
MKIARIETLAVNVSGINNWSFVRVTVNSGLQGVGEMTLNAWEPLQQTFLDMLTPQLIGMPAAEALSRLTVYPHMQGGQAANSVMSAVEQALCDILARAAGQPLHAWLGTAQRKHVRVYANIDRRTRDRTPAGFAASAKQSVADGYTAVKITPFEGVLPGNVGTPEGRRFMHTGLERIYATREAIGPGVDLLMDCHWRFDEAGARDLIRETEAAHLFWIECIVSENPEHRAALGRLRALAETRGLRLAGAERQMGLPAFNHFINDHLLDVVMPDVKYAGGCRELVKIAAAGARRNLAFSPHNPSSPVCSLASMHVCAVAENVLILEHQIAENDAYRDVINEPLLELNNGGWTVPDTPGLGVTLNDAAIRARPFKPTAREARMDVSLG